MEGPLSGGGPRRAVTGVRIRASTEGQLCIDTGANVGRGDFTLT